MFKIRKLMSRWANSLLQGNGNVRLLSQVSFGMIEYPALLTIVLLGVILLSLLTCFSKPEQVSKPKTEVKWDESVFTVETVSLADSPTAIWVITQDGNLNSDVDLTVDGAISESVIKVFSRQPQQKKSRGIFIYSKTYAIPDTPEERQWMTEYLWQLYHNPEWRKSEAALIAELQAECEKQKIPLYVNLSANLQGKWKKLAPAPGDSR